MFEPLSLTDFSRRTGLGPGSLPLPFGDATSVVSLRDVSEILSVQAMPVKYLETLLRNVTLSGDGNAKPYANSRISLLRIDPDALAVGQTFIERSKYRALLETFNDNFGGFCVTRGIAKRTALIVLGAKGSGETVLAHYLPPIVEAGRDGLVLLDGVHRNFLVRRIGTTIESIVIRGVGAPFPCRTGSWDNVRPVDMKPPRSGRFIDLRPELFRDLKSIGIDG